MVHDGLNFGGVSGRVHGTVQSMVNPQNARAVIGSGLSALVLLLYGFPDLINLRCTIQATDALFHLPVSANYDELWCCGYSN